MKLESITITNPKRYFEKPPRVMYEASKGYDIEAGPLGVLVKRLPDCMVALDRDEPAAVLVPWHLIGEPCGVPVEKKGK
jgi:hypothetical protein